MGLSDFFKSKNSNGVIENLNQNYTLDKARQLLKQATQLKNEGDINKAVVVLRDAIKEMDKSKTLYSASDYLRLPLYLQQAKLNDEAWSEFNILKVKFTSDSEQSIIEDKMRLFLQREKRFDEAILIGIFSYMHGIRHHFLLAKELNKEKHFQAKEVSNNLKEECSIGGIKKMIAPLLKKAKRNDIHDELLLTLEAHVSKIPNIDFLKLKSDVGNIIYKNNN